MLQKLINQAIDAALQLDWQRAIELNLQILSFQPDHIPTLNRLAKAYQETNQPEAAKEICNRVLAVDRYNTIAQKNLDKLHQTNTVSSSTQAKIITDIIEEPGKTTVLPLTRLANQDVLAKLQTGQRLQLVPRNRWIAACTDSDVYIGNLPDQDSLRLKSCIEAGNQYEAAVKNISANHVTVFVREIFRSESHANSPSFLA